MNEFCLVGTKVDFFEAIIGLEDTHLPIFTLIQKMFLRSNLNFIGLFLLSFLLLGSNLLGQNEFLLKIDFAEHSELPKKLSEYPQVFGDSLSAKIALKNYLEELRGSSYLIAEMEKYNWVADSILEAKINPGPSFTWANIKNGNIDPHLLNQSNINLSRQRKKIFQPQDLVGLQRRLLTEAENNGWPFAKIYLDSIQIDSATIAGNLMLDKGIFIKFGEVNVVGDVKISRQYLQEYLGIQEGNPYSAEKVTAIGNRIKELVFVQEGRAATVTFRGKSAIVNLFLKPKQASRGDLIFGILPRDNSLNPTENVRPLITIDGSLDWNNKLGFGERLFLEVEQLQPQRQQLVISLDMPYLLGLPFGVDGDFALYRRDSAYTEIISEVGLQYLFEGTNYIKGYLENRTTNLQLIDTGAIIRTQQLPDQLDFRNAIFGIEWQHIKLNYRFNPRKGWATNIRAGFGNKTVRENNDILALAREAFNPQLAYDSLNEKSWQIRMEGNIEGYLPLGKSSTLKGKIRGGAVYSPSALLTNEQFRLGGNQSLRGFDEENFNATNFAILTLEYRLILNQNSYLFGFGDFGYIEDIGIDKADYDTPYGMGVGVSLATKPGIFGISAAVGAENDLPLDFRRVKIHFGYLNLF